MKNIAIIPIGGKGSRMQNEIPKQFIEVEWKPIYLYTLEKFQKNEKIDKIIIACIKGYEETVKETCKEKNIDKVINVVTGGNTQLESIYNCLKELDGIANDEDHIIIRVGNRPNLSDKLITRILKESEEKRSVVSVIPEIEVMANRTTGKIIPRKDIVRIQTPQVYVYEDLAFFIEDGEKYYGEFATVCDMFLENNKNVDFTEGEFLNFKITYPEDIELFKKLINNQ